MDELFPSLSSKAQTLVKAATNEFLINADWEANLQVCEDINQGGWTRANEYGRVIAKRLEHKDPNVALLTLTLTETIMNNCAVFHPVVADNEFFQILQKLVRRRQIGSAAVSSIPNPFGLKKVTVADEMVTEKVLKLFIIWSHWFNGSNVRNPFHQIVNTLARQGEVMPNVSDAEKTPPECLKSSHSTPREPNTAQAQNNSSQGTLSQINENATLLREILQQSNESGEDVKRNEVVQQLHATVITAQKQCMEAITMCQDQTQLIRLLTTNDSLLKVLEMYDILASGKRLPPSSSLPPTPTPTPIPSQPTVQQPTPPPPQQMSLLDLFSDTPAPASRITATQPQPQPQRNVLTSSSPLVPVLTPPPTVASSAAIPILSPPPQQSRLPTQQYQPTTFVTSPNTTPPSSFTPSSSLSPSSPPIRAPKEVPGRVIGDVPMHLTLSPKHARTPSNSLTSVDESLSRAEPRFSPNSFAQQVAQGLERAKQGDQSRSSSDQEDGMFQFDFPPLSLPNNSPSPSTPATPQTCVTDKAMPPLLPPPPTSIVIRPSKKK